MVIICAFENDSTGQYLYPAVFSIHDKHKSVLYNNDIPKILGEEL